MKHIFRTTDERSNRRKIFHPRFKVCFIYLHLKINSVHNIQLRFKILLYKAKKLLKRLRTKRFRLIK